uniref:Secreted protein n=1 Tax=Heterorhabditis bacteriophora TaxID=37862 RepID=A0A1I7X3R7_HETBA
MMTPSSSSLVSLHVFTKMATLVSLVLHTLFSESGHTVKSMYSDSIAVILIPFPTKPRGVPSDAVIPSKP